MFPSFTTMSLIINHKSFFFSLMTIFSIPSLHPTACPLPEVSVAECQTSLFSITPFLLVHTIQSQHTHTDSITSQRSKACLKEAKHRDFLFFLSTEASLPSPINSTQQQVMWVSRLRADKAARCVYVWLRFLQLSVQNQNRRLPSVAQTSYSALMLSIMHKFRSCSATLTTLS